MAVELGVTHTRLEAQALNTQEPVTHLSAGASALYRWGPFDGQSDIVSPGS